MARRRSLHPEEEELWQTVARSARPMHKPGMHGPGMHGPGMHGPGMHGPGSIFLRTSPTAPEQPAMTPSPAPRPVTPTFRIGEKAAVIRAHDLSPSLSDSLQAAPVRMDAKAFARMTRGKLAPEARIDLHGLTLAEAHPELIRFILTAQGHGMRLVLVITGKGKRGPDHGPIPQRMGALRHQVPQWLRQPPVGQAVLQVAEAHLKHGGTGAYYVYLRRR